MRFLLALFVSILVAPAHGVAQCTEDAALVAAAATFAIDSSTALMASVRAAGSDAPVARAFRFDGASSIGSELDRAREEWGAPLVCGEAQQEGDRILVIAPRLGRLRRTAARTFAVELAAERRNAELVVLDGAEHTWRAPVRSGDTVELAEDLVEPFSVQLVADGPGGPRPIAELWSSSRPPNGGIANDVPLAWLGELRERAGVAPLRSNRRLSAVAGVHAQHICREGRVGHLDDGRDPRHRLAEAGLRARHVGETVSRAADEASAFAALLRSPSHRAALLDRRFTDVGIASDRDARARSCLVVLLAAWPRPVPYRAPSPR